MNQPRWWVIVVACGVAAVALAARQLRTRRAEEPHPTLTRIARPFTAEELAPFNGNDDGEIYVSVKGIVYQVGVQFYGPGEPYHVYAGKDVSRNLAIGEVSDSAANLSWDDGTLSETQLDVLNRWSMKLESKYRVVGWFIFPPSFLPLVNIASVML